MMARRILVLACLLLAVAPLQSVSAQEGGVAQAEDVDLDEVLDTLVDTGIAEVGDSCAWMQNPRKCSNSQAGQSKALRRLPDGNMACPAERPWAS